MTSAASQREKELLTPCQQPERSALVDGEGSAATTESKATAAIERDPKGKGAWYFTYIRECPVCGRGDETRERRYDERPENPTDRVEFNGMAYDYCLEF